MNLVADLGRAQGADGMAGGANFIVNLGPRQLHRHSRLGLFKRNPGNRLDPFKRGGLPPGVIVWSNVSDDANEGGGHKQHDRQKHQSGDQGNGRGHYG